MQIVTDYEPTTGMLVDPHAPVDLEPVTMTAQYAAMAAVQRQLGALSGRVSRSPEYVIIPKPDDYAGPVFVLDRGGKRRIQMRFRELSNG